MVFYYLGIMEKDKKAIIDSFYKKVRGQKPPGRIHDGGRGHWIENRMGISPNGKNAPDLNGYEMKDDTNNKTTFGDWSPTEAIFKGTRLKKAEISRSEFLKLFGQPNQYKNNRPSWSGKPCPKVSGYNEFGQILKVTPEGDVKATYSFSKDSRINKYELIPTKYQVENLVLAKWSKEYLKNKLESKFNQKGWFKLKLKNGVYSEISFGGPIDFSTWIRLVKKGVVFFDCGMYEGNSRNYCQWRASNALWESLIVDTY